MARAMGLIYVVGTADTKGEELAFLAARVADAGGGAARRRCRHPRPPPCRSTFRRPEVASHHPGGATRSAATTAAPRCRRDGRGLRRASSAPAHDIAGIVGIGGGGGTSIVTAGMRALPIGVPKLMVSTLASGDVGPYVDVATSP